MFGIALDFSTDFKKLPEKIGKDANLEVVLAIAIVSICPIFIGQGLLLKTSYIGFTGEVSSERMELLNCQWVLWFEKFKRYHFIS